MWVAKIMACLVHLHNHSYWSSSDSPIWATGLCLMIISLIGDKWQIKTRWLAFWIFVTVKKICQWGVNWNGWTDIISVLAKVSVLSEFARILQPFQRYPGSVVFFLYLQVCVSLIQSVPVHAWSTESDQASVWLLSMTMQCLHLNNQVTVTF